jgi:hypothetical protein
VGGRTTEDDVNTKDTKSAEDHEERTKTDVERKNLEVGGRRFTNI